MQLWWLILCASKMLNIPIAPPWVDSSKGPNRVNRGPLAHQGKFAKFLHFLDFSGLWKKWPQMAPNRAGRIFVPTNPDLANILGRTDFDFENFYFFDFLDPTFLDFQVPRSANFWISRSPDLQIHRFPGSQFSRRRRRRRRQTNSQIPTWPLSQRTQGSNTLQGPLLRLISRGLSHYACMPVRKPWEWLGD